MDAATAAPAARRKMTGSLAKIVTTKRDQGHFSKRELFDHPSGHHPLASQQCHLLVSEIVKFISCRSLHLQLCGMLQVIECRTGPSPAPKDGGVSRVSSGKTRLWLRPRRDGRQERLEMLALVAPRVSDFLAGPGTLTLPVSESRSEPWNRERGPVSLWLICPTLRNYRDGALNEPLPRARNIFSIEAFRALLRISPYPPLIASKHSRNHGHHHSGVPMGVSCTGCANWPRIRACRTLTDHKRDAFRDEGKGMRHSTRPI